MVVYAFVSGKRDRADASHREHWKRLRERFNQDGLAGFHSYEVIELLLTLPNALMAASEGSLTPLMKTCRQSSALAPSVHSRSGLSERSPSTTTASA